MINTRTLLHLTLVVTVSVVVFVLLTSYLNNHEQQKRHSAIMQYLLSVKKEAEQRLEKEKRIDKEIGISDTQVEDTAKTDSEVSVAVISKVDKPTFTSGPYKGMTYGQSIFKWKEQMHETDIQLRDNIRKTVVNTDARLASVDKQMNFILSVCKLLSKEQLEHVRNNALKTMSKEQVDEFFHNLYNHNDSKTADQISRDASDILQSKSVIKAIFFELDVEMEQIKNKYDKLNETKPVKYSHLLSK